ncbi:hypothetical protein MRB53_041537 [Persea americana]|nr:hypothetical protein MRB53_041537 [Persea americana]
MLAVNEEAWGIAEAERRETAVRAIHEMLEARGAAGQRGSREELRRRGRGRALPRSSWRLASAPPEQQSRRGSLADSRLTCRAAAEVRDGARCHWSPGTCED